MGRIATAVFAASRRSLLWLFRRSRPRLGRRAAFKARPLRRTDSHVETILGERGATMTPAQAAAFTTRSANWRCISCGKVHAFDMPVRVGAASPCSCLQIEFETDARKRPARFGSFRTLPEA
jgi:hypothetical protein